MTATPRDLPLPLDEVHVFMGARSDDNSRYATPAGDYYSADDMHQYAADCVRDALAIEGEAAAWQCRGFFGGGWVEWQECSKEDYEARRPLQGYCYDELETEFRALYTTTPAVGVDEAMVERACETFWPSWKNANLRSDADRERMRITLTAALEAKPHA